MASAGRARAPYGGARVPRVGRCVRAPARAPHAPVPTKGAHLAPARGLFGGGRDSGSSTLAGDASSAEREKPAPKTWPPKFGSALAQGPREYMEDTLVVHPDARCGYLYAGLFDGHEGAAASTWLRDNLYEAFAKGVDAAGCDVSPIGAQAQDGGSLLEQTLSAAFNEADATLAKHLSKFAPPDCFSGSTATSLLVRQDRILAANVGDSRAVLARGGKAIDLTSEHRVYGPSKTSRAEVQRIKDAGGWVQQGRVCGILAVSRAFGDWEFKVRRAESLVQLRHSAFAPRQGLALAFVHLASHPVPCRQGGARCARGGALTRRARACV